jgi:N-succinyldiaminopimelate aminotransferase
MDYGWLTMFNNRLDRLGDYPFDRLRTLLDVDPPAAGHDVISLALGEPQHPAPEIVRRTVNDSFHLWGKYPPVWGTPEFRAAIVRWMSRRYGIDPAMIDADRSIIPVSGTREALFMIALTAIPETVSGAQPTVLMPNPFYQVYVGAAALSGAEPVFVPARVETNFLPDYHALDEATLARTALAYFCNPSNPQGTVAPLDQLVSLVELARAHDFIIVFDECYSEIYDRDPPPGGVAACAALGGSLENVVIMNSLSKRSSVPGLRSGFVAGDPDLMARFKQARDYGGAPPPLPLLATAEALWNDEVHVEENRALYRAKFDLADRILSNRLGYYRPDGGFYLWLDVEDGEKATHLLWTEAALRVMPGDYLSRADASGISPGSRYIRCAMVHDLATTEQALMRLSTTL